MAFVFIGLSIIIGSGLIAHSLDKTKGRKHRYEFVAVGERNIIIFDKETGSYWQKLIEQSEGSAEWKKQESPIAKQ
ncbi:hypothetical protein PGH26_07380 [Sporosarcina jeotgali]|uniref:Uncharacterized protein n=1 Tax=Sporosarcina jeotgali TaxID=3020056 RepID=A0ABZ0KZX6_9BACL|nr:hypothetical protein [Sporosarcina sp. B2O-1]WOV85748.1 hypothetical protein PGH26_07380 [Sporosarcina sp. B2O-1]